MLYAEGEKITIEIRRTMIPTREKFKDFIAAIKKAQEKEESPHFFFSNASIKAFSFSMLMCESA